MQANSAVIDTMFAEIEAKVRPDLVDISKEALEVANINCENLKSNAKIIQSDMFDCVDKKYDVISKGEFISPLFFSLKI